MGKAWGFRLIPVRMAKVKKKTIDSKASEVAGKKGFSFTMQTDEATVEIRVGNYPKLKIYLMTQLYRSLAHAQRTCSTSYCTDTCSTCSLLPFSQ